MQEYHLELVIIFVQEIDLDWNPKKVKYGIENFVLLRF